MTQTYKQMMKTAEEIEKKDAALYKLTEMTVDDFNKVTSMTVDEFQNQLEKHKIECSTMDNYVFDLAKAIKESSNE